MAVSESTLRTNALNGSTMLPVMRNSSDEGDDGDHGENDGQPRSDRRDAVDVILGDSGEQDRLAGRSGHLVQAAKLAVGGIGEERGLALNGEKRRAVGDTGRGRWAVRSGRLPRRCRTATPPR